MKYGFVLTNDSKYPRIFGRDMVKKLFVALYHGEPSSKTEVKAKGYERQPLPPLVPIHGDKNGITLANAQDISFPVLESWYPPVSHFAFVDEQGTICHTGELNQPIWIDYVSWLDERVKQHGVHEGSSQETSFLAGSLLIHLSQQEGKAIGLNTKNVQDHAQLPMPEQKKSWMDRLLGM